MSKPIDVLSPADQEGTEAVVLRWLKRVGEAVNENEPLLELETDKVTVEVPAPASGQLAEILKNEKEAVEPGAVLGRILAGEKTAAAASGNSAASSSSLPSARLRGGSPHAASGCPGMDTPGFREAGTAQRNGPGEVGLDPLTRSDAPLSPAVKRLLTEHRLDPTNIPASGKDGRLTAQDISQYIERQKTPLPPTPSALQGRGGEESASRRVPHTPIRRRIAAHMVESMATAPHVTTLFQADLSRVIEHRTRHLQEFEARGVKLTYTAYFVAAAAKALQAVPEVNSRFHEDSLEIFSDCNIGVGTALGNEGLIVPVLHKAQTLDLFGIAQRLGELVNAARANKLAPEAVRGGTFTISNHGVSGSLLAAPIVINQPQVAIMGVGKLERRVVVEDRDGAETLAVKPMCYLTLTLDHRALDAFQANAFLSSVVETLEAWPQDLKSR